MTSLLLASYVVLWVITVALSLLLASALLQIRMMQLGLAGRGASTERPVPDRVGDDGPEVGSRLPILEADSINGFGRVTLPLRTPERSLLLVCMSPMCESCQHAVAPLNGLVEDSPRLLDVIVILRADDQACRAFLSVFPMRVPAICDSGRDLTMRLDVHRNPFGLLYDGTGVLVRKGVVANRDNLLALLGDLSASATARAIVFPPLEPPVNGEETLAVAATPD